MNLLVRRSVFKYQSLKLDKVEIIICLITSQNAKDDYAVSLASDDLANGQLKQNSNIRPNRLFTIDAKIILYRIGTLKKEKTEEVTEKIIRIFS